MLPKAFRRRSRHQAGDSVAVIVPCHNYGRYLAECLDSVLAQTHQPTMVVVVDDASTDNTPQIAAEYAARGVLYLRVEFHDVALARNAGAELAGKPAYYLFLDADDVAPKNYLQQLLAGMDNTSTGVTYAQLDRFTESQHLGLSPWIIPFNLHALRRQNFATSGSLIRRAAFEQVGGWRSYRYGLHDWDLWLRITSGGWKMKLCDVALRYRVHAGSMSDMRHGKHECGVEVMARSQLTTIVTLFCGRSWMLTRWFASLASIDWPRENLHMVAVDNSRSPAFAEQLRHHLDSSGLRYTYLRDDARILPDTSSQAFATDPQQRTAHAIAMNRHIARLYAEAGRYLPSDTSLVWSIEDDIQVPPDALRRLSLDLFRLQAGAISASIRSRYQQRLIAWTTATEPVHAMPRRPLALHQCGFGCLLLRRAAWDQIAWRSGDGQHPYYDWAACRDLRQSSTIYLAPIGCEHWQNPSHSVVP